MKSVRLLPVVIFAALALLVFKAIGLVTSGGYVLAGPGAVVAQEAAVSPEMSLSADTQISDISPTLDDIAPTLATKPDTAAAASEPGSDAAAEPSGEDVAGAGASDASSGVPPGPASASDASSQEIACPPPAQPSSSEGDSESSLSEPVLDCLGASIPLNAYGDAIPMIKDANGKIVPLTTADHGDSEAALLQRLSGRRAELDKREAALDMRESLVKAAEQQLAARSKALSDLESRVNALVDEKQSVEDASFKAIVTMYEQMKPKDAANIFDTLELPVLLKVARAMDARKMSPILAAMTAAKAQALTTAFATTDASDLTVGDRQATASLPQIVGH